jgi:ribosomal-protein-alanine N-acetyltransferase
MSRDLIESGLGWRYTPARMAALIADPETITLVACDATHIQGFAVMGFGDTQAHLSLLCVMPAQQQRGIGRALVGWLLESARVAGIHTVTLEVRADNAGAARFYGRLGFAATQHLSGYYSGRVDAQRMRLKLG